MKTETKWMFEDEIADALASQQPERIAAALHALTEHIDSFDMWPLQAPSVADLAPFGVDIPERVLRDLLYVWAFWDDFDPPFGDLERRRASLDLLALTGSSAVAYETALDVRISDDPAALPSVIAELASRAPARGVPSFVSFVDHLLDGSPAVRAATVEALRVHAGSPIVQAVRAAGLDRCLTAAELERLGPSPRGL